MNVRQSDPSCLHLWVPQLGGVGGIQQYSRALLRGLEELLPETRILVLSKNDAPESLPARRHHLSFRTAGNCPALSRTAFYCELLMRRTLIQRPDLAILTHLHFAPIAYALKGITGLRYWVSAHGIEAWGPLSPLMRRAIMGAEKVLPVSGHTGGRLFKLLPTSQNCHVLSNAVDGEAFFPAPKPAHLLRRYGLSANQKVLFTLARLHALDRYKGYDLVIEALPQIRNEIPDVHYVLAGRGAENERIRRQLRQLGLQRHVTLTGFLPDRDLRDHYNLCDLFVMPSVGEGFGIVYLEALACGRPALAGNEDGSREALLDGELGLLVEARDTASVAAAISDLLVGRSRRRHDFAPDYLRRRTLERFGFDAFKTRLRAVLDS